jgi:cell division protein FtsA
MGSGRVTCVVARPMGGERLEAIASASSPCRGLKGGVVVNIAETARAISIAIEEAEQKAEAEVHDVYLGVRGSHLQSFNNRGAINIARTDKEITAEDVQGVIENAKAIPISNDREIVHVVPQGYSLDRQRGVPNPVGMEGSLLEVEVHIVTASSSHLSNLVKSVNKAGFNVVEPVYGLLAAGELVVTPEEKELGCLLIDLGGQTISLGIYSEGSIKYTKELSIGSDFITRDLAFGLRTSLATAETIKEKHGVALSSLIEGEEDITFVGVDGRTPHTIKPRTLLEFVQPRIEQIFSVVSEDLHNSNYSDLIAPSGAILTGGGALLKGMQEAASEMLEMPVRVGRPHRDTLEGPEGLLSLPNATSLGLVCYPTLTGAGVGMRQARKGGLKKKFSSLFEDIF